MKTSPRATKLLTLLTAAAVAGSLATLLSVHPASAAGSAQKSTVDLSFTNLPVLTGGAHYEAWAEVDGKAASLGKFSPTGKGLTNFKGSGAPRFRASKKATGLFVTIEPPKDNDLKPSEVRVVAGAFAQGRATLSSSDKSAIGTDFRTAKGDVLVAAPTAPKTDPLAGVWWYNPTTKSASITIPALSPGWVYEGWVVLGGQAVTTGQFSKANEADRFNGYSGEGGVPAVPGEDFVRNAPAGLKFPISVANSKVFITVEPISDGDPKPFSLAPLTASIPATIGAFESVPMTSTSAEITGTATFK